MCDLKCILYFLITSILFFGCKKEDTSSPQEICDNSTSATQLAYETFISEQNADNCFAMLAARTDALADCITEDNEKIKDLSDLIDQFDCNQILCDGLVFLVDSLIEIQINDPNPEICKLAKKNANQILNDCLNIDQELRDLIEILFDQFINCDIDVVACSEAATAFQMAQDSFIVNSDSVNCALLKIAVSEAIEQCGEQISPEIDQLETIINILDCDPNSPCNSSLNNFIAAISAFEMENNSVNCINTKEALSDVIDICGGAVEDLLAPIKEQFDQIQCP